MCHGSFQRLELARKPVTACIGGRMTKDSLASSQVEAVAASQTIWKLHARVHSAFLVDAAAELLQRVALLVVHNFSILLNSDHGTLWSVCESIQCW